MGDALHNSMCSVIYNALCIAMNNAACSAARAVPQLHAPDGARWCQIGGKAGPHLIELFAVDGGGLSPVCNSAVS